MTTSTIEQTVLGLSKQDRARLVHVLLDSLDEGAAQADMQQLWLQASVRRAIEIDQGEVKLVSSDTLEAQVQALLR